MLDAASCVILPALVRARCLTPAELEHGLGSTPIASGFGGLRRLSTSTLAIPESSPPSVLLHVIRRPPPLLPRSCYFRLTRDPCFHTASPMLLLVCALALLSTGLTQRPGPVRTASQVPPEQLLTSHFAHGPKAVSTAPPLVEPLLAKPRQLIHNGRGGLLSTVDPLRRRPPRQRHTNRRALDRASAATDTVTGTTFGGVAIKLDASPCSHPQGRFFDSTRPAS